MPSDSRPAGPRTAVVGSHDARAILVRLMAVLTALLRR
jgi:hypothetical protein